MSKEHTVQGVLLALAALATEWERQNPGSVGRAWRALKREPDRSLVWTMAGEHESSLDRLAHAEAEEILAKLSGHVAIAVSDKKDKGRKRKRA